LSAGRGWLHNPDMASSADGPIQATLVLRPPSPWPGAPGPTPVLRAARTAAIRAFADTFGLEVDAAPAAGGNVGLRGSAEQLGRAFGVDLYRVAGPAGTHFCPDHPPKVPDSIAWAVAGVVGLDQTPAGRSRLLSTARTSLARALRREDSTHLHPVLRIRAAAAAPPGEAPATVEPLSVGRLVAHYGFPTGLDGTGQRIAIISLGGGFHEADVEDFFRDEGLRTPVVRTHAVNGADNAPLSLDALRPIIEAYNAPDVSLGSLWQKFPEDLEAAIMTMEATMDLQIAGAAAPGAEIDVYFAPNSPRGLHDALHAAIDAEAVRPPTVISLSWGWAERQLAGDDAALINEALKRAWSVGVCVCCASGDSGSVGAADDDPSDNNASVLFPASSPWVLGCGGTELSVRGSRLADEIAWNDVARGVQQATGGGVSGAFEAPWWQSAASVPARAALNGAAWIAPSIAPTARARFVGRGVPDVAAYGAQSPGYRVRVGGAVCGAGGTSAATPLWAGLVARLAQRVGDGVRWLPQLVYDPAFADAVRPITRGTNAIQGASTAASFSAGRGWNACCGVGVPHGERLLACLVERLGVGGG
jgi:kumamolisin